MEGQHPLSKALDDLEQAGRADAVSAGEIPDALQQTSLGMLLTLLGLITIMPLIGDIPGAAITTGTLGVLAVAQSLRERRHRWLPVCAAATVYIAATALL